MHARISPHQLLHSELKTFERRLSGVWDGVPEDVHDARVATRRIRELLTILASPSGPDAELSESFRQLGRSLGSVRELDVMEEHLRRLAALVPPLFFPCVDGSLVAHPASEQGAAPDGQGSRRTRARSRSSGLHGGLPGPPAASPFTGPRGLQPCGTESIALRAASKTTSSRAMGSTSRAGRTRLESRSRS